MPRSRCWTTSATWSPAKARSGSSTRPHFWRPSWNGSSPATSAPSARSRREFDPISTEGPAERFAQLTSRVDAALESARDAKDGIASSFDVLIVRTEHRTNEIVKVFTLASILLLPGALLAGVAGMNVNFKPDAFADSGLFWVVAATMILIALSTLGLARRREWWI